MSAAGHNQAARAPFDVLVVAASLGGPAAVGQVLAALPADFPVAVLVVQHRTPAIDDSFTAALRRRTALPTQKAREGQPSSRIPPPRKPPICPRRRWPPDAPTW